jgi:hypothetical protein
MRQLASVVLMFSLGCGDVQVPVQPTPSLPAPTTLAEFSLSGDVYDTAGRPLGGARVEVTSGARAGTVTTTDGAGRFSMSGTFTGAIAVTVSKDGYVAATRTFSQHVGHTFSLEPIGPSANIAGVYTLTLTADSACITLPDEVRTRTYTATIVPGPRSTSFLVRLSDARFFSTHNIAMGVAGDFANFATWASINGGPGIVEQVSETIYVLIEGGGGGLFGASGMTAPFDGYFQYCPSEPALRGDGARCLASAAVQCDSHNHQLTLALIRSTPESSIRPASRPRRRWKLDRRSAG